MLKIKGTFLEWAPYPNVPVTRKGPHVESPFLIIITNSYDF